MCFVLKKKDKKFYCINSGLSDHVSTCICTAVTMAKIEFLTILLTATCFLGCVVSVTDKEFEVSDVFMEILLRTNIFVICLIEITSLKLTIVILICRLYP